MMCSCDASRVASSGSPPVWSTTPMSTYSRKHLTDQVLLQSLTARITEDRSNLAALLADLAEVDSRRLYLPAAFSSMHAYCVHQFGFTEHAAYKRIAAARAARDFPDIFEAVADGRLHLSAVVVLAPHLVPETANELIRSAAYQTKSEIERLIAAWNSTGQ